MPIMRSISALVAASAIGIGILAAPAAAAPRIDWDDPLTAAVEKAPKTKISKGEYRRLHKKQSYAKATRIVHGKGRYLGHCVEGGPCGDSIRWYFYQYRDGKMKSYGEWVPEAAWLAFKNDRLIRKFHS